MTDTALRIEPRNLPPVEPVQPPSRFSMSLLNHAQNCKRAGYLYVKHRGGTPGPQLDFGTAYHLVQERLLSDLFEADEKTLYAAEADEDPVHAKRNVASSSAAIVDEVLREHPELTLPLEGGKYTPDKLRELAYHLAVGNDIDPARATVERMFALDLACGMTLVGKLDAAELVGADTVRISDAKTTFATEAATDIQDSFQLKTYGVLFLFGYPLDRDGSRDLPLGRGIQWVEGRETYPRFLDKQTGLIRESGAVWLRQQLADFRIDLERLGDDLLERFTDTWKFPAVPGDHCRRCPSRPECPLPPELRDYQGAIETDEQAAIAAEWHDRMNDELKAVWREMRGYAKEHGPFAWGVGKEYAIEPQVSNKVDREGLFAAAREAAATGAEFDPESFVRPQVSSVLKKRDREEALDVRA